MALARDSHLENIPLLDESPVGYVFSHDSERSDGCYIYGTRNMPLDRSVTVLRFEGISHNEDLVPASGAPNLKTLLGYFYSGGQVRVFRDYPAYPTAWNITSNPLGYSDMVPQTVGGNALSWYSPMRSFDFELKGFAL